MSKFYPVPGIFYIFIFRYLALVVYFFPFKEESLNHRCPATTMWLKFRGLGLPQEHLKSGDDIFVRELSTCFALSKKLASSIPAPSGE